MIKFLVLSILQSRYSFIVSVSKKHSASVITAFSLNLFLQWFKPSITNRSC